MRFTNEQLAKRARVYRWISLAGTVLWILGMFALVFWSVYRVAEAKELAAQERERADENARRAARCLVQVDVEVTR